ncbi:MAG: FlgD immunoglobulin-like domain containing protein [bacterium]
MNKLLPVILGVILGTGVAYAADPPGGRIGLFADQAGTTCNITDATPGLLQVYVVHIVEGEGVTASGYIAAKPACMTATYLTDTNPFPLTVGNSQTGAYVLYGTCLSGAIHVQTINFLAYGTTPTCCQYAVTCDPLGWDQCDSGLLDVLDCNSSHALGDGLIHTVNGDAGCPCPLVPDNFPPATPSDPAPGDMTTNQPLDVQLSWTSSDPDGDPLVFDVWFGTILDPPLVSSGQSASTYDPGPLAYGTTYYWRVAAKDDHGHEKLGPKWQFTTELEPLVRPHYSMAADNVGTVHVFDAEAKALVTTLPLSGNAYVGDCAIRPDGVLGFVTDYAYHVWVIELGQTPPILSPWGNPIPISNAGEELEITADGRFLVVCDGSDSHPISVVDVASRTEVSTFALGTDCSSISLCDDGTSVLVASLHECNVRRLTIDGAGYLTDTGEMLLLDDDNPWDCYCAPGSQSGVAVTRGAAAVHSFTVPGLQPVNTRSLSEGAICGTFNPAGDRLYIRTSGGYAVPKIGDPDGAASSVVAPGEATPHVGAVEVFGHDPVTGALSASPLASHPIEGVNQFFCGMDRMAMNPSGTEVWIPESASLNVYDPVTFTRVASISKLGYIVDPMGICLGPGPDLPVPVFINSFQATVLEGGVSLSWQVVSDQEVAGFRVLRRSDDDALDDDITSDGLISAAVRTYRDDTVLGGTTYEYTLGVVLTDRSEIRSQTVRVTTEAYALELHQNTPNPFNPTTTISFTLPESTPAMLSIYDVAGALVRTLMDETVAAGYQKRTWDGKDDRGEQVSSGVYFYRLTAGKRTLTKKMVLLK